MPRFNRQTRLYIEDLVKNSYHEAARLAGISSPPTTSEDAKAAAEKLSQLAASTPNSNRAQEARILAARLRSLIAEI